MNISISSSYIRIALCTLGGLVLLLGSFSLGLRVGERKAQHFNAWSENYNRQFQRNRGPSGPMRNLMMPARQLPDAHGVFGHIISVKDGSLVMMGKDNIEQTILVSTSTMIRMGRTPGTMKDLRANTDAAVFGEPNATGQIEATLLRIFPNPTP